MGVADGRQHRQMLKDESVPSLLMMLGLQDGLLLILGCPVGGGAGGTGTPASLLVLTLPTSSLSHKELFPLLLAQDPVLPTNWQTTAMVLGHSDLTYPGG